MYLKRTPHLESEAIRLRSEGRIYQEIADILTKSGHPVSKATVHGWFRDGLGAKPTSRAGQPAPSTPPAETPPAPPGALRSASEPADGLEVDPDELRAVVTEQIRRGRAAVREAERGDRPADARAAERTLSVWVKLLQQIQAKSARNSSDPTATTCPECRRRLACRPEGGAPVQTQTPTRIALQVRLWDGEARYVTPGGLLSRDRSHARIFGSEFEATQYAELHLDPKTERAFSHLPGIAP